MKHSVQKADEQLFVELRTEESLKTKISMWINVFLYHNAAFFLLQQQIYGNFVDFQTLTAQINI